MSCEFCIKCLTVFQSTWEIERKKGKRERKRERKGEELTVEIDQGKHTQEMLEPAAGLNCLIVVTGFSTWNNTAI